MTLTKNQIISHIVVALVIYVLVYLFFFSCNPQPVSVTEAKNTEIKYKNKLIEVSKKEDKRKIDDLSNYNKRLLQLLQQSNIDKHKAKKWLKSIENGELADYYNNRLNVNDVKTTNNGTEFTDSTLSIVTSQLIDCDYLKRDYATLFKMNSNNDSISKHYRNMWKKTETQSANNYQMYVNDSTALANIKEVKFRLLVGGGLGFTLDTPINKPIARVNIGVQVRSGKIYGASYQRIGTTEYILGEANIPIFSVKGRVKD